MISQRRAAARAAAKGKQQKGRAELRQSIATVFVYLAYTVQYIVLEASVLEIRIFGLYDLPARQ